MLRGGVTDGNNYGAIAACEGSTVQVEGCDLSSEAGSGVYAEDEDTDLRLKDYSMHNCNESGVVISQKAKATTEGCQRGEAAPRDQNWINWIIN